MTKEEFRNAVVEGIKRVKGLDAVTIADDETFTQTMNRHRTDITKVRQTGYLIPDT